VLWYLQKNITKKGVSAAIPVADTALIKTNNMKPIIIYSDITLKLLSWFMRIGGITLFPFIILREKYKGTERGAEVLNHEKIHIEQQKELLVLPFYVLYILFFIMNIILMRPRGPYREIPFEKEAYANEKDFTYLKNRKRYAWVKCFRKKSCLEEK